MILLSAPFRTAVVEDAPVLAQLVNAAGEGLPLHLWSGMATAGQDPWEIGRQRQAASVGKNEIVVVDFGKGAVAGLTGYAIGGTPDEITDDTPPLFRPLIELENEALNSWYVNVLAVLPHYRGQGLGSRLLAVAEDIARDAGIGQMSIIVAGDNEGARRLYERRGYSDVASRPCVKDGWDTPTDSWHLLLKDL